MKIWKKGKRNGVLTLHDVVSVSAKTDGNANGQDSKLPDGHGGLGGSGGTGGPSRVDGSPGADGVTDIVGTVSEGSSASSDNLDERVCVLDLVGVLLGVGIDTLHALTLGSTLVTTLGSVDIVVETVKKTDSDDGRDALGHALHVAEFVDLTGAHGVVAEKAHSPTNRSTAFKELGVVTVVGLGHNFTVGELIGLEPIEGLLLCRAGDGGNAGLGLLLIDRQLRLRVLGFILNHSVVGDLGNLGIGRDGTSEEKRALDNHPPFHTGVLLDDAGVEERNEEDSRQKADTATSTHSDSSDVPAGLLVQTQVGGTLVHNGERANGGSNQEEERSTPDGPGDRVSPHVNEVLDQQEDNSTKATGNDGSHAETSEDGTKTLAVVPAPLNLGSTNSCNTDTGDSRDERVGGGDVGGVFGTPHHP